MAQSLPGFPSRRFEALGLTSRILISVVVLVLALQIVVRLAYRIVPTKGLSRLARALDRPVRRYFLNPKILARRVGIRGGMRVLSVGPGDGQVILALAGEVGSRGRVEAVALDVDDLRAARELIDRRRVENASVVGGTGLLLPFPDDSFDAICAVSLLGRVSNARQALAELRRVVRPAGRVSFSDVMSDPTYLRQPSVVRLAEAAGFELIERFGDAVAYTANFRKPVRLQGAGPPINRDA
ncbi:MAG TPA: methyltransferase domain-containing protein [Chloroflexota bacterium]|nr:methyltransferase domain-containing protein [Chloroflexota bacterium]